MISCHKFNEHETAAGIAQRLKGGERIALVSDAGTPAISDPGFMLVRECRRVGVKVECLPGATAFVPALVDSGLPCDKFCFEGFLPQKKRPFHTPCRTERRASYNRVLRIAAPLG